MVDINFTSPNKDQVFLKIHTAPFLKMHFYGLLKMAINKYITIPPELEQYPVEGDSMHLQLHE